MKKILVTIPVREKDRKFLEEKGKEFQFCYRTKEEITVSDVVDAEIILGNIPVELVPKAKKLKFLQLDSAGSTEYTDQESSCRIQSWQMPQELTGWQFQNICWLEY